MFEEESPVGSGVVGSVVDEGREGGREVGGKEAVGRDEVRRDVLHGLLGKVVGLLRRVEGLELPLPNLEKRRDDVLVDSVHEIERERVGEADGSESEEDRLEEGKRT